MSQSIKDLIAQVTLLSCLQGLKAFQSGDIADFVSCFWILNIMTNYFFQSVAPSSQLPIEKVTIYTCIKAVF